MLRGSLVNADSHAAKACAHTDGNALCREPQQRAGVLTPALVVNKQVVEDNISRLQTYANAHGIKLRPHTKTHKSRTIADWQLREGAAGLTFAKPSEAVAVSNAGESVLIAYPVVDFARAERIAFLARDREVIAAVDSVMQVEGISSAAIQAGVEIGLVVEIDVGLGRTGVQSSESAAAIAKVIDQTLGLTFAGLICYPGHVWNKPEDQNRALSEVDEILAKTIYLLTQIGLEANIVSGGSTPTAYQSHIVTHQTEIRPGTYVFNDMNTFRGGFCELSQCAAKVICTVVSDAKPNQIVVDAGSKTLAMDKCLPDPESGFGFVPAFPEAKISYLSEEHGQIDFSAYEKRPRIGERLDVIPNHICPCVNLTSVVWIDEGDDQLYPIQVKARGART